MSQGKVKYRQKQTSNFNSLRPRSWGEFRSTSSAFHPVSPKIHDKNSTADATDKQTEVTNSNNNSTEVIDEVNDKQGRLSTSTQASSVADHGFWSTGEKTSEGETASQPATTALMSPRPITEQLNDDGSFVHVVAKRPPVIAASQDGQEEQQQPPESMATLNGFPSEIKPRSKGGSNSKRAVQLSRNGTWPRRSHKSKRRRDEEEIEELSKRFRDTAQMYRSKFKDIYTKQRQQIDQILLDLQLTMSKNGYNIGYKRDRRRSNTQKIVY